jgi:hypothetical protein
MKGKKNRTFTKLNPQRQRLLKAITQGNNIGEAGRMAGYAHAQSANRAIREMRPLILEAMAKYGWDIDRFARHQVALLEAKKTIFAQREGIFTDKRTVADNATRLAAQEQCLKMLGVYAPLSVEHLGTIEHVLTERERREAEESVKTILACDSEEENPLLAEFVEEGQS